MLLQQITKICSRCSHEKPISEFAKHSSCKHGVRPECKVCTSEDVRTRLSSEAAKAKNRKKRREYYLKNKELLLERNKKYRRDNADLVAKRDSERKKRYRVADPEKFKERNKQWSSANKEKVREKTRRWTENNAERKKQTNLEWKLRNSDRVTTAHGMLTTSNRLQASNTKLS